MSSKVQQLEYQEKVPIAYVSSELFWGWDSAYTHPKTLKWFEGIYTPREIDILDALDVDINRIRLSLPKHLPPIEEFIGSSQWTELNELVEKALIHLKAK